MPAPLARYFTKKNVMNIIIAGVYHHLNAHLNFTVKIVLFLMNTMLECATEINSIIIVLVVSMIALISFFFQLAQNLLLVW